MVVQACIFDLSHEFSEEILNLADVFGFFSKLDCVKIEYIKEHLDNIESACLSENDVKVSEILEAISESWILLADVIRAKKTSVINQTHFLMVAIPHSSGIESEEMAVEFREWIQFKHHSA